MSEKINSSKQIRTGAILSYIGIGLNVVIGLLYTPWLIEQIGESDYGLYSIATTLIGYFLIDFGLGNSISRFVSKFLSEKKQEAIDSFLGSVYKLYLIVSLIILTALCVVYLFLDSIFIELTVAEIERLKVVYCIAGLFSVLSFPFNTQNGILISYELFIPLKLSTVLQKLLSVTLMIIALSMGQGLYSMVAINAIAGCIIIFYKCVVIKRHLPIKINWKKTTKSVYKSILSFSLWVTIIGIADQLLVSFPIILLGVTTGTTAVTIYSLGKTIHGYVWQFGDGLNGLFMTKVSNLCLYEDSNKRVNELMIRVGRIQCYIIVGIVVGFALLGNEFVHLWLGDGFQSVYIVTLCIITPYVVILPEEIGRTVLYIENKIKYRAYAYLIALIVALLVGSIGQMWYGAQGAAFGVLVGSTVYIIVINIVYRKIARLDVASFFKSCYLSLSVPVFISAVVVCLINNYIQANSFIVLAVKGVIYLIVYLCLCWLFAFNQYEKDLVAGFAKVIPHRTR